MTPTTRRDPVFSHHLLEAIPDGVAYVDEDGVICHANECLQALTGYARDELVGHAIEMLVPPRYRQEGELARHFSERAVAGDLHLKLLRRDGEELEVDAAIAPVELDGKNWTVVAIRDDSAQRAAEDVRTEVELRAIVAELAAAEALASSEQRFRLAFENNMAGMIFVDLEDKVLAANDSFCEMIGRRAEEIIGQGVTWFTHPEDRAITEETHRRLVSGEADRLSYVKRYLH